MEGKPPTNEGPSFQLEDDEEDADALDAFLKETEGLSRDMLVDELLGEGDQLSQEEWEMISDANFDLDVEKELREASLALSESDEPEEKESPIPESRKSRENILNEAKSSLKGRTWWQIIQAKEAADPTGTLRERRLERYRRRRRDLASQAIPGRHADIDAISTTTTLIPELSPSTTPDSIPAPQTREEIRREGARARNRRHYAKQKALDPEGFALRRREKARELKRRRENPSSSSDVTPVPKRSRREPVQLPSRAQFDASYPGWSSREGGSARASKRVGNLWRYGHMDNPRGEDVGGEGETHEMVTYRYLKDGWLVFETRTVISPEQYHHIRLDKTHSSLKLVHALHFPGYRHRILVLAKRTQGSSGVVSRIEQFAHLFPFPPQGEEFGRKWTVYFHDVDKG